MGALLWVGAAATPAWAADTDRDGVQDGSDNCANLPNADQGDCNGNGVGNLCEGAWANRDDDGDGICNGVDGAGGICAREAGTGCAMQAITVPWIPSNPSIPHSTYSGASTTLKGIARYGGTQYRWDYGDGSPVQAWTTISNAYNLGVSHVYNGVPGQVFIATLSVGSGGVLGNPAQTVSATYPVKIELLGGDAAIPANGQMDPSKMDTRINMAIDEGLWYLHVNQSRSTFADGNPGYAQPYGTWGADYAGCTAVDAFELHGSKPNKDYTTDPYVETVQRGLNYMLTRVIVSGISGQQYGNPDTNGNGVGVYFAATNDTYQNGICGVSFASSGSPARQALVGSNTSFAVVGRTYKEIAQDMVDWFAYGQTDGVGYGRGGWWYAANSNGADGSTNQWPILTLAAAEDNMSITIPAFVRTEAPFFMNQSRHTAVDNLNGGWGYQTASDPYVNNVKTAAGFGFNYLEGNTPSHPQLQAGLGFLYRHWNDNATNCCGAGGDTPACGAGGAGPCSGGNAWNCGQGTNASPVGNSYTMYGIMKAMRKPSPQILRITEYDYQNNVQTNNSFDWYYTPIGQTKQGLATNLVRRQAANGSWSDNANCNNNQSGAFATGWDVLILQKGVTVIPPTAIICDCSATWDQNQTVTLDGSCSHHADLNRTIVKYEWDFDYLNGIFTVDATGQTGVKVGGYQAYQSYTVALRVTDDNPVQLGGPQSSIVTCQVKITPPPHCPHADAGGPYQGFINTPVSFDASGSSDPDNDPLTYAWDLDNDGIFGAADHNVFGHDGDGVGKTPSFTFNTTFLGTVAVQVTDHPDQNPLPYNAAPCTVTAFSSVEIGNHAPTSNPGGPYTGNPGQTITLDGTGSSDPDPGDSITYGWDLNNDGVFNDSTQPKPSFTIPGNAPDGSVFSVCLKVTDSFGKTDTKCTTVTTKTNRAPTCSIKSINNMSPNIVASCTGGDVAVAVDATGSSDPDGNQLTYKWTTDCTPGTVSGSTALATITVATANSGCNKQCAIHLAVSDGEFTTNCDGTITITDTTPPTFDNGGPANATIECNGAAPQAVATWLGTATATDQCSGVKSVANDFVSVAGGCGGATGTATVTFTAEDNCNQSVQTSATLTIADTVAPNIVCAAPVTAECTGAGTAVSLTTTASDDCFGNIGTTGPAQGNYPLGTTTVSFGAQDSCGNSSSCNTSVTIIDTTKPSITCGDNQTVECQSNGQSNVNPNPASASDVCDGAPVVSNPGAGSYPLGTTTVTHTATDGSGNVASCTNTITVQDTTAPEISCPAPITVECQSNGQAQANPGTASATDACDPAAVVTNAQAGSFPLGTTTTNYSVQDGSGNVSTCTSSVTVVDTTKPVFGPLPAPQTILGDCWNGNLPFVKPTATDGCTSATVVCGNLPGTSFGTNTITCTATDQAGNSISTTITVTVVQPLRIVFTAPIEDDNQPDNIETDLDVVNKFKSGQTIPHKISLLSCNGVDVTGSVSVTVKLDVTERQYAGNVSQLVADMPEVYQGVGDAGGTFKYVGPFYHYNLDTNGFPAGTVNSPNVFFRSLVTVRYQSAPNVIAGQEDATLESK